jgi:alpha-1,3-glucan synthase
MLWGTSSLALYIPWAGKAGPYLGLSLWLWLGVLDAIQGVGLGMILLQTLSRLHVCATLAFAQVIGSICVMVARATAPNRIGPGTVFPDIATWDFQANGLKGSPMAAAPFWIALICQLIIVVGYFWFYRKEQLGTLVNDFSPVATANEGIVSQPDHDLRSFIYVTYYTRLESHRTAFHLLGLVSLPDVYCLRDVLVFPFDLYKVLEHGRCILHHFTLP